jgi:hypothetical protein
MSRSTAYELPEEVLDLPWEDDADCGPSEEDLENEEPEDMNPAQLLENIARLVDPMAFRAQPQRMADLNRRDRARRRAASIIVLVEAFHIGVVQALPAA